MGISGFLAVAAREMTAFARGPRLRRGRTYFPVAMVAVVLVTSVAAIDIRGAAVDWQGLGPALRRACLFLAGMQPCASFAMLTPAALAIAGERDRKTLDFLLATRLGGAEIVLGKLAALLAMQASLLAAGLPVFLLAVGLSGADPALIVWAYLASASATLLLASFGLVASISARDGRAAIRSAALYAAAWSALPFFIAWMPPRFGWHLPGPIEALNAFLLPGTPMGLVFKLAGGPGRAGAIAAVARFSAMAALGAALLLAVTVLRLRVACREAAGGGGRSKAWKFRRRPDVSDDPIFWRERHTGRPRGWRAAIDGLIWLSLGSLLAVATAFFARRALAEVFANGYASGAPGNARPDVNLVLRVFLAASGNDPDQARMDFNMFLRMTALILGFAAMVGVGFGVEAIGLERAKGTWTGLIATPLSGREILLAKLRAALYRLRPAYLAVGAIWGIGLFVGALHPIGAALAALQVAAWTWMFLACGLYGALRAKTDGPGSYPLVGLTSMLVFTGFLPYALPTARSSVLLGAASMPFDVWLSLVSYRDVRSALGFSPYLPLRWMGLETGEGLGMVLLAWGIGFVGPILGGWMFWKRAVTGFDRYVGRPWRDGSGIDRGGAKS